MSARRAAFIAGVIATLLAGCTHSQSGGPADATTSSAPAPTTASSSHTHVPRSALDKRLWRIAVEDAYPDTTVARAAAVRTTAATLLTVTHVDLGGPGNMPVWFIQIEAPKEFLCISCKALVAIHARFITDIRNTRTFRSIEGGYSQRPVDFSRLGKKIIQLHP